MSAYPAPEGRKLVLAICDAIESNKAYLSEVDGAIGDGDHGINMAKGFRLIRERLAEQEINVTDGLALIGKTLMTEIGGSMGPLYGTLFIQMSLHSKGKDQIDNAVFRAMLHAARTGVEEIGGAKVGDKTIVDVLGPADDTFSRETDAGADLSAAMKAMGQAADQGRDSTKDLVAKIGRASRLGERSRGTLDAGATSGALILNAIAHTLA